MHVVIGGASGFLGRALIDYLQRRGGYEVTRLVRSGAPADDTSVWDPAAGRVDQDVIDRADVVVNLSGASVSRWPRTKSRRAEILSSRLTTTATLAKAVAQAPKPPVFLSASGMSWYGVDRGDTVLTESSTAGSGFLADVTHEWEDAAAPAAAAGARTCFIRTSLVLGAGGGILALMVPVWKLGGGARLGSGRQYMSLIAIEDWVRAAEFLMHNESASGPFNFAMPTAVTNAEFTRALGKAVHRPAFLVGPSFAVKAALGGISEDLLGSLRIEPKALVDLGFSFAAPDLHAALESATR